MQGGASISHREADVPSGQDKISRYQEESAALLSALCVGEPRHVSEGRKAEGVLHDDGISAPLFPNFPLKRAIQEAKIGKRDDIARAFTVHFVKFVSVFI